MSYTEPPDNNTANIPLGKLAPKTISKRTGAMLVAAPQHSCVKAGEPSSGLEKCKVDSINVFQLSL